MDLPAACPFELMLTTNVGRAFTSVSRAPASVSRTLDGSFHIHAAQAAGIEEHPMNDENQKTKHESGDRNENSVAAKDFPQQQKRDKEINEGERKTARDADRDMGKR